MDCTRHFAEWLAHDEYREAYFEQPEDLKLKLAGEFLASVADSVRGELRRANDNTVVAVSGIGQLYGFLRVSELIRAVEPDIKGRLIVFFPGSKDGDHYRLLDAQDGSNYLANSISLHSTGAVA